MGDVSATRLYLGNLPRNVTKQDVENHFAQHGTGEIKEVKLMNGFGFVEYSDAMDARDVVPDGTDFMGERLVVQFARGSNRPPREFENRTAPRPRRTVHRMTITGLPLETSWQDLKDFSRTPGPEPVYSEVGRERGPDGTCKGFVEYETAGDLDTAVAALDNKEFKGASLRCISDTQSEIPRPAPREQRYRSRSPPRRYGQDSHYDRRGPERGFSPPRRGFSPRRDEFRRRSPAPEFYRGGGRDPYLPRSPPPPVRRAPDDYAARRYEEPARRYPDDPYNSRRPYEADPYANGHGREPRETYGRPASPPARRDRGYGGGGGGGGGSYDDRRYWPVELTRAQDRRRITTADPDRYERDGRYRSSRQRGF